MRNIEKYITSCLNALPQDSLKDAFWLVCDEMDRIDWYVAKSKQQIIEITHAECWSDVHEGETFEIDIPSLDSDCEYQHDTPKIVVTEYYYDSGDCDYAYVVEAYDEDGELAFSSLAE